MIFKAMRLDEVTWGERVDSGGLRIELGILVFTYMEPGTYARTREESERGWANQAGRESR